MAYGHFSPSYLCNSNAIQRAAQLKRAHSFTALRRIEQKTVIMSDGEVRV